MAIRKRPITAQAESVATLILPLRDQRVILDTDLARVYGVQTRVLNQAVKRNSGKFPKDFVFDLTREEILRISQTVTSLRKLRFSKQVRAFTEHGALMAATVLNSSRAVKMSLFIIRAFVKMREDQAANSAILRRLAEIDQTLLTHDTALRDIYKKLLPLLAPPPESPKPQIGFHLKEDAGSYRFRRRPGGS
jgi:hypothetical protein